MKKKWLVATVLSLAVAMAVTGCSGGDDSSADSSENPSGTAGPVGENIVPLDEVREKLFKDVDSLVKLGQYKDIEVTIDNVEVSDVDVDEQVALNLQQSGEPEQITEGTVADGDTVNIDYAGKVDGEDLENGSATGQRLVIGSGSFIEGFDEGLIGVEIGSTVEVNATFPDEYEQDPSLSGKAAVFTVTVNYVEGDTVTPELTDEWVVDQGIDNVATVDQYRDYVRASLEDQAESDMQQATYVAVMDKIMADAEVSGLAEDMDVESTKAEEIEYAKNLATNYGYEYDDSFISLYTNAEYTTVEEYENSLDGDIQTYYERIMIYRAIAKTENIEISEEDYEADVTELSADYANYGEESAASFEENYSFMIYESDIYTEVESLILDSAIVTKQ